ncbi:hypothetical protein [Pseudogemmobacter faecipullorum]|uniref:Uncharacterized protein n=1 Tax=Pseudogemmobacter faecipullorum TaxID=2755041 RepID=A0ABS8CSE3_9RHOB|nr:hypothetical protein [Pseudogemmobacter faecipullorum]MCB5412274.1 hypothetical protein [Pseudogemmobacter faecipullorum]
MTQPRICGFDLNGWKDRVTRNWAFAPDGEEIFSQHTSNAILNPAIVRMGEAAKPLWVGGAQASLAPHGRGGGWGQIGEDGRRKLVFDLLRDASTSSHELAAALSGLARGGKFCAIAIEDHPWVDEVVQERLLAAMSRAKIGRGLLVWRSVLAVLGALSEPEGLITPKEGLTLGIIGHSATGFTVQTLELRAETGRSRRIYAPQRRRTAQAVASHWGYAGLVAQVQKRLAHEPPGITYQTLKHSDFAHALALDGLNREDIIRNPRGDFHLLKLTPQALTAADLDAKDFATLRGCDVVLFESVTSGAVCEKLADSIEALIGREIIVLPEEIVASGAFEAARRYGQGEPVYFDFLPQISTIIMGREGAESHDLIDKGMTVAAGKMYRSQKPAHFMVQNQADALEIYLSKETQDFPRRADLDLGVKMGKDTPVELYVEQTPASGRARIFINSSQLPTQFVVDWDLAEVLETTWEALIAKLDTPKPTIPVRMVLACGEAPWTEINGAQDVFEAQFAQVSPDWKALSQLMTRNVMVETQNDGVLVRERLRCISSDGAIPEQVSVKARQLLKHFTDLAMDKLREIVRTGRNNGNEPLIFLTWQFRNAPAEVISYLFDALETKDTARRHPFIRADMSWVLIHQGIGRCCNDEASEQRAIDLLLNYPMHKWKTRRETAMMSFLLSRSDTAPLHLTRGDVDRLVDRAVQEFKEASGGDYTDFNYAPLLMAGLLRWRLKEPYSLVRGYDLAADRMASAISNVLMDMRRRSGRDWKFDRKIQAYLSLLPDLLNELEGQGTNPNLLRSIVDA